MSLTINPIIPGYEDRPVTVEDVQEMWKGRCASFGVRHERLGGRIALNMTVRHNQAIKIPQEKRPGTWPYIDEDMVDFNWEY
jgi:hypothetical protein